MSFARAMAFTAKEEGGYANHPTDPGGATNKGITQKVYDDYRDAARLPRRSVRSIEQHEVDRIYIQGYWVGQGKYAPRCDEIDKINEDLAVAHFDFAVNSGGYRANQTLQRVLGFGGNDDDGIIGPMTLGALARADHPKLLERYIDEREEFMLRLVAQRPNTYLPFLLGWMFRIRRLRSAVGLRRI